MWKSRKNIVLIALFYFFLFIMLSGCSIRSGGIINTEELYRMNETEVDLKNKNYDMVRLDNGIVVYKDNAKYSAPPSEYKAFNFNPASAIKFGPEELKFDPGKVDPKRKK